MTDLRNESQRRKPTGPLVSGTADGLRLGLASLLLFAVGCGGPSPPPTADDDLSAPPLGGPELDEDGDVPLADPPELPPQGDEPPQPGEAGSNESEPVADLPAPEDGEAYAISEIMVLAHKSGLYKRVRSGEASAKEAGQLVTLYTDLAAAEPPEGELEDWRERTGALLSAAEELAAADDGPPPAAVGKLNRWVNCNSCHNRHRS